MPANYYLDELDDDYYVPVPVPVRGRSLARPLAVCIIHFRTYK